MAKWIYEMPNGADLREAIDDGDCHMVVEQVFAGVQNIVNFASREKDSGRIDKDFYENMYCDFQDFMMGVSDTAEYMETEEGFSEVMEEYDDFEGYIDTCVLSELYNLCDEYRIWIPVFKWGEQHGM